MARPSQRTLPLPEVLAQLQPCEFRRFKYLLRTFPVPHGVCLPQLRIELSNRENLIDVLSEYPRDWVGMVVVRVLEKMRLRELANQVKAQLSDEILNRILEKTPMSLSVAWASSPAARSRSDCYWNPTQGEEESYKGILEIILQNFWKNNFWPGGSEDIYVDPEESKTLLSLCNPKEIQRLSGHTLVLHGPAGFGKTTLAKKLMLEWTKGSQAQVFRYAFYLRCREFNYVTNYTFAELISKDYPEWENVLQRILEGAPEVLFVLDGFDELKVPAGGLVQDICGNWKARLPVFILLSSLLKRKMVPKATVLVTTRPQALQKLFILVEQPLLLEVKGFGEQDRQTYFLKHFGDEERAMKALEAMKSNATLLRMGSAPAVCWMLCTCLELQIQRDTDLSLTCQTCTSLFLRFLCSRFPLTGVPSKYLGISLEAMCFLAAQGLWSQMSVFYPIDLENFCLKYSDFLPFLDKQILLRDGDRFFIHPSIQQFLAAIFYILKRKEKEGKNSSELYICDVTRLFSKVKRAKNPSLVQTARFLFGLFNEDRLQELETTFGCQISMEVRRELLRNLRCSSKQEKPYFSLTDHMEVFACLYESQNEELVKEVMAPFKDLSVCLKTSLDLMHASLCLKNCQSLQKLTLQIAKGVFLENDTTMQPKAQAESFQNDQHLLPFWKDLCSSIENVSSLDINSSVLSSSSVQIFQEILTSVPCRLQHVFLSNISPADVFQNLCLAFSGYEMLTHLTIGLQDSQDCVISSLCEMLRHPRCKLKYLRLRSSSATTQRWDDLFQTLKVSGSVTRLSLANSELMAEDAEKLCVALKDPRCLLQFLSLENCHLTEACCKELSSVLMASQTLTRLILTKNSLGDEGVKVLCEGLCYPGCKLEYLVLQECSITPIGCRDLAVALRCNKTLTSLNLAKNCLEFDGIKTLCEALAETTYPQRFKLIINSINDETKRLLEQLKERNPQVDVQSPV